MSLPFFSSSSTPQPELNVSWNLDVSIINMDRKSTTRSPLVLTQGAGKGSPNIQRKCGNPTFSLFSFFSPLFFILLPPRPQAILGSSCSGVSGAGRSLNLRGKGTFQIPLLFFSLCSSVAWPLQEVTGSTWQNGVNEAPGFCWKAEKGKPQETKRLQENEELGKLIT